MGIGNVELMHECFPKHSRMRAARMKQDKKKQKNERREEWVWKEVKRARKKKEAQKAYL